MQSFGGQTMYMPLRRVVVRRPDAGFGAADPARWHYRHRPDLAAATAEHDAFVATLREAGAETIAHAAALADHADAIYVHDPVLISDRGAILLRMGKPLRRGEEEALGATLEAAGVPIHARLTGDALAESGDILWLDPETLAVGLGFRTNAEAVRQLRQALSPAVNVLSYDLPYHTGPSACLHLMSFVSLLDERLAVGFPRLMPTPFYQELMRRGFTIVDVPEQEYDSMGCNVLALGPRDCLMLDVNPVTKSRLEAAGCRVRTYRGAEISLNCEGGPTCLTRPVLRG
ncbi:MAG: arginine deiminase family protein [Gemmatimonadota bacterium]